MGAVFQPKKHNKIKPNGFTLIEMVAVLAIVGVMATALFPAVEVAVTKANDTKLKASKAMINGASQVYRLEHGKFPEKIQDLVDGKYIPKKDYHGLTYNKSTGEASESGKSVKYNFNGKT